MIISRAFEPETEWNARRDYYIALIERTPTPCELYQCAHREKCAKQSLACQMFLDYVKSKRGRAPRWRNEIPTKEMFDAVFERFDRGANGQVISNE